MTHNLNISTYSLDELLGLFDISSHHTITLEDMKRAKKKVLMLHPDKSKLGPEYFLFYKKALDIVAQYFQHQNRQHLDVAAQNTKYSAPVAPKSHNQQINQSIQNMGTQQYQEKFNQLFEENMAKKIDPSKNAWFSNNDPIYENVQAKSASQMSEVLATIKQKNHAMIQYSGVMDMQSSSGTNFYDDEEDASHYVSSDPFSKLKYDDLRKVHKDQTVFAVSESDYQKVPKYSSVDHFVRERGQTGPPIDKFEAEKILAHREREMQQKMMQRQHQSNLQTMHYEEKNKNILSSFLHLTNK
uniref:J domain-containing protein n=1 Tax=viral metagenome TaxID=1070528 RepID=A0A6C0KJS4_9ZZZZ